MEHFFAILGWVFIILLLSPFLFIILSFVFTILFPLLVVAIFLFLIQLMVLGLCSLKDKKRGKNE